jgi:8-oxo-dGTP pyrophosphatase MutT (NUDIX family)
MTKLGDYALPRFKAHPWVLPGGSVEPGEKPSEAAVRELREETGIEISPAEFQPIAWMPRLSHTPHVRPDRAGELLLLFGAKLNVEEPAVTSNPPETIESRWIELNLGDLATKKLADRYGGVFPVHHAYWARLAQAEMMIHGSTPRFYFYRDNNMSNKPWLNIEKNLFEIESLYA